MKNSNLITKKFGFTIVELLVVIVVIGIMSAIIIVSYIGVTGKAVSASLQSDLANAKGDILIFQAEKGVFPVSVNDCPNPVSTKICFNKYSPGNSYTYYQADNTSSPKTFSLYASNSNGTSNKISSSATPTVVKNSSTSCLAILNAGDSTGSGVYLIKPASNPIAVYCDMTTDGGGWTRLNNNIASSTTLFNSSDTLLANNVPGNCGTPGCAFTINNISVAHTNVKINLTRTTSIIQCASLVGVAASTMYWNGSTWISRGMCGWNDGVFANATTTDMTGLKMLWKLEGPKAGNGEIKFTSQCSGGDDNGQMQITAWVK